MHTPLLLLFLVAGAWSVDAALREAVGKGFHLELVTRLDVSSGQDSCDVWLVESFPSGAFVDVDQIKELERFNGMNGAKVKLAVPFIDVEKPKEASRPFEVEVLLGRDDGLQRRASIPFHLRYHSSNANGNAQVSLSPPLVCSTCALADMERTDAAGTTPSCVYRFGGEFSAYKAKSGPMVETIVVKVPVGDVQDLELITLTTITLVLVGTLAVVHSALSTSRRASKIQTECVK